MRVADDGGLGHCGVLDQRAFHLGGAHAVAGYVNHVIDAACDPVIAVLVAAAAVAGEVHPGIGFEVSVDEALVVAIDRAHLARPAVGDAEVTFARTLLDLALRIDDDRPDAEERAGGRAGLEHRRTGQRCDQNAAGLGLPPCVYYGAAVLADYLVIPVPGLRVDWLAHRAQQADGLARGLGHRVVALAHQRADGGRSRVVYVDLVLVADFPVPRGVRVVRHALEDQGRRAVGQRAINDIAVAGNPAAVRRAPVDVAVVIVEDVLVGHGGVDHVAACRVQHALRLTRRARGVEDEQRVFRAHRFGREVRGLVLGQVLVPDVAVPVPRDVCAGALHHHAVLHVGALLQRLIDIGLQRDGPPAAQAFIGGDDEGRFAVPDPAGDRVRGEAAEHHGMDCADPSAGQHSHSDLGDHRQVDGDPVALLNT